MRECVASLETSLILVTDQQGFGSLLTVLLPVYAVGEPQSSLPKRHGATHTCTVMSSLAEARYLPSGDQATVLIRLANRRARLCS
jgi:hypothetical protein